MVYYSVGGWKCDFCLDEGGLSVCFKENDDKTFQEILLTMAKGVSLQSCVRTGWEWT